VISGAASTSENAFAAAGTKTPSPMICDRVDTLIQKIVDGSWHKDYN
jgi:hypothetical protein